MDNPHTTDQRLTDLEIKSSFSEVIIRQQQQIDSLMYQLVQLREQRPESGATALHRAADELPPHY